MARSTSFFSTALTMSSGRLFSSKNVLYPVRFPTTPYWLSAMAGGEFSASEV